ncbi:hypothetical protein WA026_018967 [Henosepilachna vigintioctopunctata]|uniref:Uncharacterized protein n=1 Tax=Henosepilachna vigintioctopunctata TaxID=420089 RepID=A0AAW1UQ63_9CUCU
MLNRLSRLTDLICGTDYHVSFVIKSETAHTNAVAIVQDAVVTYLRSYISMSDRPAAIPVDFQRSPFSLASRGTHDRSIGVRRARVRKKCVKLPAQIVTIANSRFVLLNDVSRREFGVVSLFSTPALSHNHFFECEGCTFSNNVAKK